MPWGTNQMFKKMILTAACTAALFSTSTAHADPIFDRAYKAFIWNEAEPHEWTFYGTSLSGGGAFSHAGEKLKVKLSFTYPARPVVPGEALFIDGVSAKDQATNRVLPGFPSRLACEIDHEEAATGQQFIGCYGDYITSAADIGQTIRPVISYTTNGAQQSTSNSSVSYIEPPFDDGQHANVVGVLTSHADRKIRKAGEVITFAFNVSDLTRSIPSGDYIRVDPGAADIVRNDGSADSNQDFGFTCPSIGAGLPVGGGFSCSGVYTVKQADIDAEGFMLAFGAALSTRDFNLWGGSLMENFEVEKMTDPETPTPDDDETTACKPMPAPAGGAKFVFRYPTGGAACS